MCRKARTTVTCYTVGLRQETWRAVLTCAVEWVLALCPHIHRNVRPYSTALVLLLRGRQKITGNKAAFFVVSLEPVHPRVRLHRQILSFHSGDARGKTRTYHAKRLACG